MPHACDDLEARAADVLCGVPAGSDRHERIAGAVNHERGGGHPGEQGPPVAGREDRTQLARRALGIKSASCDALEVWPQDGGLLREPRAADDPEQVHEVVDDAVDVVRVVRRAPQQGAQRPWFAQRDLRTGIAGRGHDRGQRQHAFGRGRRQDLRDHAAHRGADDVGLRHARGIEHRECIHRHVAQLVGCGDLAPEQRADDRAGNVRHGLVGEPRRAAAVPVVERDHPEPVLEERRHELVGPHRRGHAEAHDQQQGRAPSGPAHLVLEPQPVDLGVRHGSAAPTWPCPRTKPRSATRPRTAGPGWPAGPGRRRRGRGGWRARTWSRPASAAAPRSSRE